MRHFYSFLDVKDALEIGRTCSRLHNVDGDADVFRYSQLSRVLKKFKSKTKLNPHEDEIPYCCSPFDFLYQLHLVATTSFNILC
jgi:hypothetical protein